MNLALVEQIANAVLYEGYMLYPYTASSVKNRQRWNFGVLYPTDYDTCEMQTECLAVAAAGCALDVRVRFLQSSDEQVCEREVKAEDLALAVLAEAGDRRNFAFEGSQKVEGELRVSAACLKNGLFRITAAIRNRTPFPCGAGGSREEALERSMLSTHTILALRGGEFLSLTEPPPEYRENTAACRNVGTWPVLVGAEGERDAVLSSPIILYDYPRIAPESPGDLFDATEIDEILTLRILTLSEEEKAEIRAGDDRARRILERSETLPPEQFLKLHGAVRGLRQVRK